MATYTCVFVLLNQDKTWDEVTVHGLSEEVVTMLENNYAGASDWTYEHISCVHAGPGWITTLLSEVEEEVQNIPIRKFMHFNLR